MRREVVFSTLLLTVCSSVAVCAQTAAGLEHPQIRFLTWGTLPFSREITADSTNQRILFAIREGSKDAAKIASEIDIIADTVEARLIELSGLDLVVRDDARQDRWISNLPIYDQVQLREAERISKGWAEKEASILRNSLHEAEALYDSLLISEQLEWSDVAWVVVGGLIADLGVLDRVRFFPNLRDERLLPQLHPDDRRWSHVGFVDLNSFVYEERDWSFAQAWVKDSLAGFAMFGFYKPDAKRQGPPHNPLYLAVGSESDVLFSLTETPMSLAELAHATGVKRDSIRARISVLMSFDPPALSETDGYYSLNIPIFPESDFKRLLVLTDSIASKIHIQVQVPYNEELRTTAREMGSRWPLPDGTLVRDIALSMLAREGLLPPLPTPPIPWSFGVWGWQGFFPLWEDVR